MKPLFKNKTTLSKENYIDLVEFHQKQNNWKYWLYTVAFCIFLIVTIVAHLCNKNYGMALLIFIILLAFLAYRFIYPYYKTGKEYHSEKIQKSLVNLYYFYDKYFTIKNKLGNSKLRYRKLYRVYENDNYFYLYLDENNALILEKSGFEIGNSRDFKEFIKHKVKFKFKN